MSSQAEFLLARCGHHPFLDGRSARHRFQTSNVYVELLSGALFTLCALAPLCTVTTGMDTTSPVVWAKSC